MKIVEFNIRCDCDRNQYSWENRRLNFKKQILKLKADIYVFCEVLHHQLSDIKEMLKGFDSVGVGRDDGMTKGEYAPIFFKKRKYELLDKGQFWLSETPDVPSMGWDAMYIRICTYAVLKDKKSGKKFAVFNTHLDNAGLNAIKNGAMMIKERALENKLPFIITGDFNLVEDSEVYNHMNSGKVKDSKYMADKVFSHGTYHGYGYDVKDASPIDYIFVSEDDFKVDEYKVCVQEYKNNIYASDHYPVFVKLSLK